MWIGALVRFALEVAAEALRAWIRGDCEKNDKGGK